MGPDDGTKPAPDPALERTQDRRGLAVAEVAEPSRQVDPEGFDHLPEAGAPCPSRQLADLGLAPVQRLRRNPPPGWRLAGCEAKAQELAAGRLVHRALAGVHPKLEPPGHE